MAYIRYGTKLPAGGESTSYVIGDGDELINFKDSSMVLYNELRSWFKTKSDAEIKQNLKQRLCLNDGELETVCNRLFEERDNGEWDAPFEFEKKK